MTKPTNELEPADGANDVRIVQANLDQQEHQEAVLALVDAYSRDPMGDGKPLGSEVRAQLISKLRSHPTTLIFLAFFAGRPVGTAICFIGFSTFAAKPLVNIHDLVVIEPFRGKGIGRRLLNSIERKARELGCCKLTLEVLDQNQRALRTYQSAGFNRYTLQAEAGEAIFLTKPLQ